VLATIALAGCGASSAETTEAPVADRAEASGSADIEASGSADIEGSGAAETTDVASADAVEELDTHEEAADPCASVVPEPSWQGEPLFVAGDPCERVRVECAWSVTLQRCALAAPVPSCPASLAEAESLAVACDYSLQPALSCTYGDTVCRCVRPHYCGGAPPPPTVESPPATFTCIPPFDDRGCPTGAVREGARCTLDPEVSCVSCTTLVHCERGRWQIQRLPPRP
jgi:hypothetical protein